MEDTVKGMIWSTLVDMINDNIPTDLVTLVCEKLDMEESTRDDRYMDIVSYVNGTMRQLLELCETEGVDL